MAYDRKQGQHQVAQSSRPDYRLVVGRADPERAAILRAWTATLIPAVGKRPDAGSAGAAEYIDATVHLVPSIRPALLHGIDEVDRLAREIKGRGFVECSADECEQVLRQFQSADDTDAFNMVSDFTYEAYYGHPQVLAAIEAETGWRGLGPMGGGKPIEPFDASLLERVRKLPPRYRAVEAGKSVKA